MIGKPALASVAGLGFELIVEIDDVVEATTGAGAYAISSDGNGQMGLAGPGTADQNDIALLGVIAFLVAFFSDRRGYCSGDASDACRLA